MIISSQPDPGESEPSERSNSLTVQQSIVLSKNAGPDGWPCSGRSARGISAEFHAYVTRHAIGRM